MNAGRLTRRVIAPTLAVLCAAVGVAFAVDNVPVAAWADAPAIASDAAAPVAPVEPTVEPVPVVAGDSVYTPSTDDCGPDAYRIEPGVCESGPPAATVEPGVEIGEAIYCDFECMVASTPTVEEDEPGWDCRTMGNGLCGVTIHGTVYVLDFRTGTFGER